MAKRTGFSVGDLFGIKKHPFLKALGPSPGFTCAADGIDHSHFQDEVVARSVTTDSAGTGRKVRWVHQKTGLEADVGYEAFSDTNVVEMEGTLTNRSKRTVRNMRGPFSLCITMDVTKLGTPRMTTVYGGGDTSAAYPPRAYNVTTTDGLRTLIGGREGGRSTETETPYAFITDPEESCGFFIALEWPCRWIFCSEIATIGSRRLLTLIAHVAYTGFNLKPGESVGLPRAVLGFFEGNAVAGSNVLRRHVVRHVRRPVQGGSDLPPVFYNHYYGLDHDWTVTTQMKEAKAYADLGMEYYVVDADWYKDGFRNGNGNWEFDDPKRFPDGMASFADYVRSLGMKFGSWLELEWATKTSHWVTEHPDWFHYSESRNYMYGVPKYDDVLLRLDDEKVRGHVADFLESWVHKYGIEWLRWDCNNVHAPFWDDNEDPEQWGRLQLDYGHGLYAVLDEFMSRCPQVHLEACATGGNRIDLGTMRRAHSAWMNDNSDAYHVVRRFQSGLNRILPGNYGNSAFLYATHPRQRVQSLTSTRKHGYPPAVLRSRMAGSLCFSEQSRIFTPSMKDYLRTEIEHYKAQRHLLMKDYYPLFDPQSLSEYDGWQFHDPETGEGFFQVFRCDSPESTTRVVLPGLCSHTTYVLKDVDTGRKRSVRGGKPLRVEIPHANGVSWCQYRPK